MIGRGLATLAFLMMAGETSAADLSSGRSTAKSHCAVCHGVDGIAKIPIAPHLAGESRAYLETQLKAFKHGKREHEIMSVIAADLSTDEIKNVSAWYSAIEISVSVPELEEDAEKAE